MNAIDMEHLESFVRMEDHVKTLRVHLGMCSFFTHGYLKTCQSMYAG